MMTETLAGAEHILSASVQQIDLGTGRAVVSVAMNGSLFYQILGETTGLQIASESDLFPVLTELCKIKKSYDRIAPALERRGIDRRALLRRAVGKTEVHRVDGDVVHTVVFIVIVVDGHARGV